LTTVSDLLRTISQERADPLEHDRDQIETELQSLHEEIMIDTVERC